MYKVRRICDDEILAIKKVRLGGLKDKEIENSKNEADMLAELDHPNIISY